MNIILFSPDDVLTDSKSRMGQDFPKYVFYKTDARYSHIKKILRLSEGDTFKAGMINGRVGRGSIEQFSETQLIFSFTGTHDPLPLPPVNIILGFPRPIQLKRILRDIASLGFFRLLLTGTELGEKSYLKSTLASETEVRQYLLDGISQAGQSLLPEVSFYPSVRDCLCSEAVCKAAGKKITLDISASAKPLSTLKLNKNETVTVAAGNERGWTDFERRLFAAANFKTYAMGSRILRTETAACSALAVILAHNGYW